jgi:hypothetical protein
VLLVYGMHGAIGAFAFYVVWRKMNGPDPAPQQSN